jgi:hypothetical protein
MIPKNSRIQISRVVRNIGPAIASTTITTTHMEHENMADNIRLRNKQLHEKSVDISSAPNSLKSDLDLINFDEQQNLNSGTNSEMIDADDQIYSDLINDNSVTTMLNYNTANSFTDEILGLVDGGKSFEVCNLKCIMYL